MDIKTFNAKLSGFKTSQVKQRDNLQELLVFGFEQYAAHGNTTPLTSIVVCLSECKTIRTKLIQDYIVAHANVRMIKKNGVPVYRKVGDAPEVKPIEKVWYEWSKKEFEVVQEIADPVAVLKAAIKKMADAMADNGIPESRKGLASQATDMLNHLMGNLKELKPEAIRTMLAENGQTPPAKA